MIERYGFIGIHRLGEISHRPTCKLDFFKFKNLIYKRDGDQISAFHSHIMDANKNEHQTIYFNWDFSFFPCSSFYTFPF